MSSLSEPLFLIESFSVHSLPSQADIVNLLGCTDHDHQSWQTLDTELHGQDLLYHPSHQWPIPSTPNTLYITPELTDAENVLYTWMF